MGLAPFALALLIALQVEEADETRFFALPMTRETQERVDLAEQHLAAGRHAEAAQVLQGILEDHDREVLAPVRGIGLRPAHPGAAEWALGRLAALPESARREYRQRHEPRAAQALAIARAAPSRASLAAIARRWPLTRSAVEAWWTLGDLELEGGQDEAAELAWRRAEALAERLGEAASPTRSAWLERRAGGRAASAPPAVSLPRGDAEDWTLPLDLAPFAHKGAAIGHKLQPIAVGDTVLVGTTLRLYAVDAYSGEKRWEAGPVRGWSSLSRNAEAEAFDGISEHLYLAPAVGAGVAVAVQQEPFTENASEDWQGIEIMVAIPERRLHAYDLATGRELWNHAPELAFDAREKRWHWDGGGTYAQRMMIAGSPIVAGPRLLVPCYRMQGRIDYHVACYELATGALLWSTPIVSGQRERNMFGRSVNEFCAAPLVVAGDRVVAQTELGTVAALDLLTGHILWQSAYRQIPLPKTRSYQAPDRQVTWRLAPPVVVGEVVIATPSDSEELLGLHLTDGTELWAHREEALQALDHRTRQYGFRQLIGADATTLYLGGGKLSALHKPGGWTSPARFEPAWTVSLDRPDNPARALLVGDYVVAPGPLRREVFARRTGTRLEDLSGAWGGGEAGNVFVSDGALFSLSNQGLSGYFEWDVHLARARRAAGPGAGEAELAGAAELFARRGRLCLEEGDLEGAESALGEARALYGRLRAAAPATPRAAELACAATQADVLHRRQREEAALAVLVEARALAASPRELLPLLFTEERVRRARGGEPRLAVLATIGELAGSETLTEAQRLEALSTWLSGAAAPEPESDPLPVALWAALERAGELERAGDLARALAELHAALWQTGTLALARGRPASGFVRERIASVLAQPGGLAAYAPLERAAEELLAAARATDSEAAFAPLMVRYPHSRAAAAALRARIERAPDALATAHLVIAALAADAEGPEGSVELLARLAESLGRAGNPAIEQGLLAALARAHPEQSSPLPVHGGRTFAALGGARVGVPPPAPARFGPGLASGGHSLTGTIDFLGTLRPETQAPEAAPLELHVYARRDELVAFASEAPVEPNWRHPLPEPFAAPLDVTATTPGCLVYSARDEVVCLDVRGNERWRRPTSDDPARALAAGEGVVVVRLRSNRAVAFDATFGLELWSRTLEGANDWNGPLVGDGHAVFFQRLAAQGTRALVLDLFRGRVTADIRLGGSLPRDAAAWITTERLIVPEFQERPARLAAFGLEDGRRAWTIEFGRDEDFQAVLHWGGRAHPVTLAAALDAGATNGGVYELDARVGSLRRIVPLKPGERLLGVAAGTTLELDAPYVFPFTYAESERSLPVRAVHLETGWLWSWSLPLAPEEQYDARNLALPAVSEELVALAFQSRRGGGAPAAEATILLLDKRTGRKVDTLLFDDGPLAQASRLSLRGLGEALFVAGHGSPSKGAGLEILEMHR